MRPHLFFAVHAAALRQPAALCALCTGGLPACCQLNARMVLMKTLGIGWSDGTASLTTARR